MKIIIICLFISSALFAQIDTTVYYPLEIGNYWEYVDIFSGKISRSSVIGDTIMPNGKHYFILDYFGSKEFFRVQDNKYVYRNYPGDCTDHEYLMYDFSVSDSSIWPVCLDLPSEGESHLGLSETYTEYFSMFNQSFETKVYEPVKVIDSDTCWNDGCTIFLREYVSKGIGLTRVHVELGGDNRLVGTIINGVLYGDTNTVVGIDEVDKLPNDFLLYQNYPNPFNPSTVISWQVSAGSLVNLRVYDVLGREIRTLVNQYYNQGKYSVYFNTEGLPSGIYFYSITAGSFRQTKKMILLR